jgi:hypothetical protein
MRRLAVLSFSAGSWFFLACSPSQEGVGGLFAKEGAGGGGGATPDAGDPGGEGGAASGSGNGTGAIGAGATGGVSGVGGAGGGAAATSGSGGTATAAGGAFAWVDFGYQPPPTKNDTCAATTLEAGPVEVITEVQVPVEVEVTTEVEVTVDVLVNEPAALYLMLDKSGSMDERECTSCGFLCQNCGPMKWEQAVGAITAFVNDPNSRGLSVGLEYFSLSNHACDGTGYDVPAVAMGELPANATPIIDSLNATGPGGGTPTEGALNGIRKFCQAFNVSNPGIQCVGVLITDGEPANCSTDNTLLANIAGSTYTVDGNMVFTVGMAGADFTFLNNVAIAGGTDCTPGSAGSEACNATDQATFLAALQGIVGQVVQQTTVTETRTETVTEYVTEYVTETQTQAVPCEYTIPRPDAGIVDPSQIEVIFTSGSNAQYLPKSASAATCGAGWYFDDSANPTKVLVCPETCTVLEATPDARIDLEFGCLGS